MPAMSMIVRIAVMIVRVDADDVERARPHPAFGAHGIGENEDRFGHPFQHHAFQTAVMVKMDQRGRRDQVVMRVLQIGQSAGERADAMIVNVGQVGDAVTVTRMFVMRLAHGIADDVANAFGTALVTTRVEEGVERRSKLVIQ